MPGGIRDFVLFFCGHPDQAAARTWVDAGLEKEVDWVCTAENIAPDCVSTQELHRLSQTCAVLLEGAIVSIYLTGAGGARYLAATSGDAPLELQDMAELVEFESEVGEPIGVFAIDRTAALSSDELFVVRQFAEIAAMQVTEHRIAQQNLAHVEQLTIALDSRVIIEQAKGIISEREGIEMEDAYSRLRVFARNHNLRLSEVATSLVSGELDLSDN